MSDRPSRLKLAQYLSDDLPPEESAAVEAQLAESDTARRDLDELKQNVAAYEAHADRHRQALLGRLHQESVQAEAAKPARARARVQPRERALWPRWLWVPAAAVAAAAAAVLVFVNLPTSVERQPELSFKGKLAVQVVAKRGDRQFMVKGGQSLAENDALRFRITTASPGYLSILSIDGRGTVSTFYPDSAPSVTPDPLRVAHPGQQDLPGSIILDDAPGPEHLIVVFSKERFDRQVVHRRIKQKLGRVGKLRAADVGIDGALYQITVRKHPLELR